MRHSVWATAVGAGLACGMLSTSALAQEDRVLAFPADYRDSFFQYYEGDRLQEDAQTIRLFANETARQAAIEGKPLPDGSLLVAEIYAAKKDADGNIVESDLGRRIPGEFKAIALMERRAGWGDQYGDTLDVGDWEFELFSPAGENLARDTTGCRECHQPLNTTEHLFSLEHLSAAN
ncbi:MAG: cytochrome P460 family protein [Geminicoccaceae bacterium]